MLSDSPDPAAPTEALCAATYDAAPILAHAFVFRISATGIRFTILAPKDRYLIGVAYRMAVFDPARALLWQAGEDADFLRDYLDRMQHMFDEAAVPSATPHTFRAVLRDWLNAEPIPPTIGSRSPSEHSLAQRPPARARKPVSDDAAEESS
jgi:hypothetical protein